ncbi:MAG: phosphoglycerate kinase [Actinomycetota bacterium]|nr:phosphoglycerate kinase [Actinomycetota bacterium]
MRTLDSLEGIEGERVLVRVDFNVPLDEAGSITDDARIRAALPTLTELRERGARLVLAAHLGRPKGHDPKLSLRPAAERLRELLGVEVVLAPAVVGPEAEELAEGLRNGGVLMLENVRFEPGETENDPELARAYARLAPIYVNDAFGAAHRAHASTEGVAHLARQSAAGRLLEREVTVLRGILDDPVRPLVAVVGGAKVTDKIGVIDAFLRRADTILIGGAMCFPFFAAQGHEIGSSLCEEEGVEPARRALAQAGQVGAAGGLELPVDLVAAGEFSADAEPQPLDGVDVPEGLMGLDVGPRTAERYAEAIAGAGTVFWNGPMGAFELEPFSAGTRRVAEAVAVAPGTTVVGGGDSAAAMAQFGLDDEVDHLSTGGGASLELIEGRALPGVEALS